MNQTWAYVGCYTGKDGGAPGLGRASLDAETGALGTVEVAALVPDPSFLALSPDGRFLYAVLEQEHGEVAAFAIGDRGGLQPLGSRPTHGSHPCYVEVHPSGRYLLSANYASGSIAVHPARDDGSLGEACDVVQRHGSGPVEGRQDGPHSHQVTVAPDGFVLDVNLGADVVHVSSLDLGTGRLSDHDGLTLAPGTGPRHLAFAPDGEILYLLAELDSSLTVCGYEQGTLSHISTQSSRARDATGENLAAEVLVSGDGRFVYCSQRGDDQIVVFATSDGGRRVEQVHAIGSGGSGPRHLAWGPSRRSLYASNENSGNVTAFAVDDADGSLSPQPPALQWPSPVCFRLADTGSSFSNH